MITLEAMNQVALAFKSETHTATNGARVEVGTVTFEGRDFAALGAIRDEARGIVCAYVTERKGAFGTRYLLTTWEGEEIAPLRKTGTWLQYGCFGGFPVRIYSWSAKIGDRIYSGRNSGPCMFVRMRAGKVCES